VKFEKELFIFFITHKTNQKRHDPILTAEFTVGRANYTTDKYFKIE
jgi:hypothetical protein